MGLAESSRLLWHHRSLPPPSAVADTGREERDRGTKAGPEKHRLWDAAGGTP